MTMIARPVARVATLVIGLAAWLGCSSVTDVDAPDLIEPPDLATPQGAVALYAGAQTLFASAFNGSVGGGAATQPNAFVVLSGLLADEFGTPGTGPYDNFDIRNLGSGAEINEPIGALSQARVAALSASQVLQRVEPNPPSRIGHLFALAAYSELFLGEVYCSGLSLTEVAGGQPAAHGTPLTTSEVFQRAAADFDSAFVYAADSLRLLQMARLGKMRALLNLARFAEAAALAAQVPTTYRFTTEHSATVQPNAVITAMTGATLTVSDREGVNGLDFRSANDPRVRTAFLRRGQDNVTDVWVFSPLPSVTTPTVLATGIEARLVEAEAALQAGNPTDWLNALNALRATVPDLTPLADPGPEGRVDLHFRERAFWLFGTGRRHSDLRRLVRQYGRSPQQVFPIGPYRLGRVYGTHVVAELPAVAESPNPNYQGCLSLGA